jgi:hypothetical protein
MNRLSRIAALLGLLTLAPSLPAQAPTYPPPAEVRAAFQKLLDRPAVPLDPAPVSRRLMGNGHVVEDVTIAAETKADGSVERVPVRVVQLAQRAGAPAAAGRR